MTVIGLDAWGNRKELFDSVEAAKAAYEESVGRKVEDGEDVSLGVFTNDYDHKTYFIVSDEGRFTNCTFGDALSYKDWYEDDWICNATEY